MKEMMIKLPVIEIPENVNWDLANLYPQSGNYIVTSADGSAWVADVKLMKKPAGEARSVDERCEFIVTTKLNLPELLDPDDFVPVKTLEENERECYDMIKAAQAEANDKRRHYEEREEHLQEEMNERLTQRRAELEKEFELKEMQLKLDMPKRFGQGEWVSGKTLKEIIEVLAGGKNKKEE